MSNASGINYQTFLALTGEALASYMEPLLTDPNTDPPPGILEAMLTELPGYDEYHLVYALELGATRLPGTFAPHLPRYLEHRDASVCSAAARLLTKLPDAVVTEAIINSVGDVRETDLFFRKPDTGQRIRIGTNSRIVAEVRAELGKKLEHKKSAAG